MKTTYYIILIILLTVSISILLFYKNDQKLCDPHKTYQIYYQKDNYIIKFIKENNDIFTQIEKIKKPEEKVKYHASSRVINFWNQINPVCSEIVYPFDEKYFDSPFCFQTSSYEICKGKKTQKGYPVAIKKNNQYEKLMYIQETYFMDSIINFSNIDELIEKRILQMPPYSFINYIKITKKNKFYELEKKEDKWFQLNTNQEFSQSRATEIINSLLNLEKKFEFEVPDDISTDENIEITIRLAFQKWKYKILNPEEFKYNILLDKKTNLYYIKQKKEISLLNENTVLKLLNNIENLEKNNENK